MYWWRITKYNPANRNKLGHYMKDEWTEFGCIGSIFEGKKFSFEEYIETENNYVNAALLFIDYLKISSFKITYLEKYFNKREENYTPSLIALRKKIKKNQLIDRENIPDLIRLLLRTDIWCKLERESLIIDISSDYYMYIGSTKKCTQVRLKIEKSGLFVEEWFAPYLLDDDEEDIFQ